MSEWDLKITDVPTKAPKVHKVSSATVVALDSDNERCDSLVVALEDEDTSAVVYQNPFQVSVQRWFEITYEGLDGKKRVGPYTVAAGQSVHMTFPGRDKVLLSL